MLEESRFGRKLVTGDLNWGGITRSIGYGDAPMTCSAPQGVGYGDRSTGFRRRTQNMGVKKTSVRD